MACYKRMDAPKPSEHMKDHMFALRRKIWRHNHRSYKQNVSSCEIKSWKKKKYRYSVLSTLLSGQLGAGHVVSSYIKNSSQDLLHLLVGLIVLGHCTGIAEVMALIPLLLKLYKIAMIIGHDHCCLQNCLSMLCPILLLYLHLQFSIIKDFFLIFVTCRASSRTLAQSSQRSMDLYKAPMLLSVSGIKWWVGGKVRRWSSRHRL